MKVNRSVKLENKGLIKTWKTVNSSSNNFKRAKLFGLNIPYFKELMEIDREKLETYESSGAEDELIPIDLPSYMESDFRVTNPKQVEQGKKINSWYRRNGFTISIGYVIDWLKHFDENQPIIISQPNSDLHMVWFNDNHQKELDKVKLLPNINTGRYTDKTTFRKTINYMEFISKNNRTDLPFKDCDYDYYKKMTAV